MKKVCMVGMGRIPSNMIAIVSNGIDDNAKLIQNNFKHKEDYRDIEFKGKHKNNKHRLKGE